MLSRIIIPGQVDKPLIKINNKCANVKRQVTLTYGDLFPASVIQDMGVNANDKVVITLHKSNLHLRWMWVGYPTIIEVACLRSDGTVGWRVAYVGMHDGQTITDCYDGNLIGEIPPTIGNAISNIRGYTPSECAQSLFRTSGDYSQVPPLNTDTKLGDLYLGDVALYLNNLPIFRTWHPTHSYSAKYSTDSDAFLELHLNDPTRTVPTYELQMNDAASYGSSSYDDAAFVFYTLD